MKKLLSVQAAAQLLSISKWTVRAYVRDGKLRPVRLGRRVLLEEAELERFVTEGREGEKAVAATPTQGAGVGQQRQSERDDSATNAEEVSL